MNKQKTITVRLDSETHNLLCVLSDMHGYTFSEFIRQAIKESDSGQAQKTGIYVRNAFDKIINALADLQKENKKLKQQNEFLISRYIKTEHDATSGVLEYKKLNSLYLAIQSLVESNATAKAFFLDAKQNTQSK